MAPSRAVVLDTDAKAELEESVRFYRDRGGEALVRRFKKAVEIEFKAIRRDPKRYPLCRDLPESQRILVKKFPFAVIYIERECYVWVIAVAHGSRPPGYWLDRIRQP